MVVVKEKIFKLLAATSIMFTPIAPALVWLGVFVFFDLITGLYKAKKANRPITSKGLGNTIIKMLMYSITLIACHVMDVVFLKGVALPFKISQAMAGIIGITEFKSILENVGAVLGMDLWKYFKIKLEALRKSE